MLLSKSVKISLLQITTYLLALFAFVFLLINIVSSQSISSIYFQLINDDKKATVEYLKKIKNLPDFKEELSRYQAVLGEQIKHEVFIEDEQRQQQIKKLEALLEKNPKARDVLYNLCLLYQQAGDKIKANKYLKKTVDVDPTINIKN